MHLVAEAAAMGGLVAGPTMLAVKDAGVVDVSWSWKWRSWHGWLER